MTYYSVVVLEMQVLKEIKQILFKWNAVITFSAACKITQIGPVAAQSNERQICDVICRHSQWIVQFRASSLPRSRWREMCFLWKCDEPDLIGYPEPIWADDAACVGDVNLYWGFLALPDGNLLISYTAVPLWVQIHLRTRFIFIFIIGSQEAPRMHC